MAEKRKTVKSRTLMYTQQVDHMPFSSADEVYEAITDRLSPVRLAVIVHDRDIGEDGTPAATHVHAMMAYPNPRSPSNVAKLLGDKPQSIQVWSGKNAERNGFSYLCHRTEGALGKYQYPPTAVHANFDYSSLLKDVETEVTRAHGHSSIKVLLDALMDGSITKDELVGQLSGSEYARARRQIEDVYAQRLKVQASEWREGMREAGATIRTIWIFGPAGTGKTSLAKKYAEEQGEPYFVSGSTRDVFQGYQGEHTLILDELRPGSMEYSDLLRITDPYALEHDVMAPARYSDKALACGLIIVTSPYDPLMFYAQKNGCGLGGIDSFGQLARRLELVVGMQQDEICAYRYKSDPSGYWPVDGTSRPNHYSRTGRPSAAKDDPMALYEDLLG